MMNQVMISLELAKLHARIDHSDEDMLLTLLLNAAVENCITYLNRPVFIDETAKAQTDEMQQKIGIVLNAPIKAAMLQVFAYLYSRRECEDDQLGMPTSAQRILTPYRYLAGL